MHMCLLWECEVMPPFLKQNELQVKGVHWAVVNLHPGFSWWPEITPRLCQWVPRLAQGVSALWAGRYSPSAHLTALLIPSTALTPAGSSCNRAQGSSLFPGYKYSSKWPMPQEPGALLEFLLRVLAGTSDPRAGKTCSPLHTAPPPPPCCITNHLWCLILILFSSQDSVSALLGLLSVLGGRQGATGKRRSFFL